MKKILIPLLISSIIYPISIATNIPAKANSRINKISTDLGLTATPLKKEQNVQKISKNLTVNKPKIQVAILLDSSNSMDGLIEQARTQIWSVINAISKVKKNGQQPVFEVSLYHYGNDRLPSDEGFNRMLNELTTDLDGVSESLFSIKTKGGQEYAGWVIDSAMSQLKWSEQSDDFKVIFIAGNEPFNQGSHNWEKAVNSAIQEDVIVNTIYCGRSESRESGLWATAATKGKGSYFNLNQNRKRVFIPTPYDPKIAELNKQLNETYIPYGAKGKTYSNRQQQQDVNAFSSSGSGAGFSRAMSKVSGNYRNSSWDLVDALTDKTVDLDSLDKNNLPENLQALTVPEILDYVEHMRRKRGQIKAQIAELSQKRMEYIAKNTPTSDKKNTLDSLMIKTLYKQLEAKGFKLEK